MNYPSDIRDKADEGFITAMAQWLSYQTPDVVARITHPTTGIHTRIRFLPSIAELADFVRQTSWSPRAHNLHYFSDEPPWVDPDRSTLEHRKAVVVGALGYDPAHKPRYPREPLAPELQARVDSGNWSINDLKTPASAPRSPQMRKLAEWCREHPQPSGAAPEFADWHRDYTQRFNEIFISDHSVRT